MFFGEVMAKCTKNVQKNVQMYKKSTKKCTKCLKKCTKKMYKMYKKCAKNVPLRAYDAILYNKNLWFMTQCYIIKILLYKCGTGDH